MRLFLLATLIGCPPTGTEKWPSTADADGDGWSVGEGDCDDNDPARHPGVTEVCDGIDANCDEVVDDDLYLTAYEDGDGDGYGRARENVCPGTPGFADKSGDCDDADASIHPGATEVCDGVDQDCDQGVDEGVTSFWYADDDQDGYGAEGVSGCEVPPTAAAVSGDCDDQDATANPGAAEVLCDGIDNDCSKATDDGSQCPGDTAWVLPFTTAHVQLVDGALVSGETAIRWMNYGQDVTMCSMVRSIEQTGPMTACNGCEWEFQYTLGPITYEGEWCDKLPDYDWPGIRESGELGFTYAFPVRFSRGMSEFTYYYTAMLADGWPVVEELGAYPEAGLVPRGAYEFTDPYDVYTRGLDYGYWNETWLLTY